MAGEFTALFYVDLAEVGVNAIVVAVADDDHVVVAGYFGNAHDFAVENAFYFFASLASDVYAVVFDGNPFDGGMGLDAKAGGNKAG